MNITNKGKKWEILNSLWILWSFTLALSCVGFFWIGGRTGRRKWIIWGFIYLVVNLGLVYVHDWFKRINVPFYEVVSVIVFCGWFTAIIHSFMSRKEYLIRREAVIDLKTSTRDAYRNEIRKDYFGNNEPVGQVSLPASDFNRSPAQSISAPQTTAGKTNLNDCSEQEISSLPGVGVALAKRAVELREQIGGFVSVQDFNQRLGLMPHFAVQIENLAFVEPNPSQTLTTEDSGRVIDI